MTKEELVALTPEQKRVKIAQLCGWEKKRTIPIDGEEIEFWFNGDGNKYVHGGLPDYLSDLNACAAMEQARIIGNFAVFSGDQSVEAAYKELTGTFATATQRADAFLLVLG